MTVSIVTVSKDLLVLRKFQSLLPVGMWVGVWLASGATVGIRSVFAQVLSDRSFGTLVNGSGTNRCLSGVCTIEGGLQNSAGTALLHSFEEFSLPSAAQSALFIDPAVDNIVVRITGGSESLINGAISASAGSQANVFFVNPSGIQFGPTARLNLGGSFIASTAQELLFDNGEMVSTEEATAPSRALLSIDTPIGLGFLTAASPAPISISGQGHLLTFGAPDVPSAFVNRIFQPEAGLSVDPGAAIKLFGNGITLSGGSLAAAGGAIELGSIATGRVLFEADLSTDYAKVSEYADLTLENRSLLEVSASEPGKALLRARNIDIVNSSAVLAETLPGPPNAPFNSGLLSSNQLDSDRLNVLPAGLIDVRATETIRISDFDLGPGAPPFHSYLSVDAAPGSVTPGGEIAIAANTLQVESGAQLGANTFGNENAGRLNIDVSETVFLSGGSVLGPSGLFTAADTLAIGQGGQITVEAGSLVMEQGAQIFASSLNGAASGSIAVSAQQVSLAGTGEFAVNESAPPLIVPTLIQSGMGPLSQGQGGSISIDATALRVSDGAEISTGTFGGGNAGPLSVTAESVTLSGFSPVTGPSGLFTTVGPGAAGSGGPLILEAEQLTVSAGAQVATSTAGPGNAGDLFVRGDAVQLSGRTERGRSGLFATAVSDRGAGGNLSVTAEQLTIEAGAAISVGNFLSGFPDGEDTQLTPPGPPIPLGPPIPPGPPDSPGQGAAGNLQVSAEQITVRDEGLISADTVAGDRGNIRLQTDLLTLRQGSRITTNATGTATGGNIEIEATTGFVVAPSEENSDITANAVFGDGGQVTISARQVLGLSARPALTPQSDITASSEFGISGDTRIENIDEDTSPAAQPLPQSTEVATVLQGCATDSTSTARFIQSGQGGLASSPYSVLNHRRSLSDVSIPSTLAPPVSAAASAAVPDQTEPNARIVEAQAWQVDEQGQVVLMAAIPDTSIGKCAS